MLTVCLDVPGNGFAFSDHVACVHTLSLSSSRDYVTFLLRPFQSRSSARIDLLPLEITWIDISPEQMAEKNGERKMRFKSIYIYIYIGNQRGDKLFDDSFP